MLGSYKDIPIRRLILGKSVHNDTTPVTDLTSDVKNRHGKIILETKTFRDGGIYLFLRGDYKTPIWFCRIKVPGMTGYTYRPTRTSDELSKYRARKSTDITKGKAAQKVGPTFGWLTEISID
jgi:hypothetical protein